MDFGLSPAQLLLRDSVASFLDAHVETNRVREIFEGESGWDAQLYRELGDQDLLGVLIPQQFGGVGGDLLDAVVIAQELGRAATPVPYHTAAILAPMMLAECGSDAQQTEWLTGIVAGERHVAPIFSGNVRLEPDGALVGESSWVAGAQHADALLVRIDEVVLLVDAGQSRVLLEPVSNFDDTRRLANVTFDGVAKSDQIPLPRPMTASARERMQAAVWLSLAADVLGASQRSLALAVDYAKQREQFERVVASFQAVKHMCAEMVADIDPLQSLIWYAAYVWDSQEADAVWLAAQTKSLAAEVGTRIASKATQVHGGIGFTWECDMHIFYKRIAYDRQLFGAPEELRATAAALQLPLQESAAAATGNASL